MNFSLQHSGTLTNTGKLAFSMITLKSQHSSLEKPVQVFGLNKNKSKWIKTCSISGPNQGSLKE